MGKNIYLGVTVKDIGKRGLSNKKEFENIIKAIIKEYKNKKINRRVAMGRLLLLYRLTFKKNNSNLRISKRTASMIRREITFAMKML